jgi:GT2 family glycosyltransferase
MSFSVVILSKNAANLEACVRAVWTHEPSNPQIIIIDDGLNPTPALLMESPCQFVSGEKPFIFARNANIGIRAAGDHDIILLNDDALLESQNGFSLLCAEARAHPEIGIIGATTDLTGQPLQHPMNQGLRIVPHIAFVCVLIPRRTINQIGLLDERYCLDYGVEDLDYCETCNLAGLKVAVHDGCFVNHSSLHSSFRGDPRMPGSFAKNYALLEQKRAARG